MDLLSKLHDRSAVVSVIGLGYAGLPLAMAFVDAGFRVLGVDVNPTRVSELNRGESPVEDVASQRLQDHVSAGRFRATGDYAELAHADTITISVPTPLGPGHLPDLSFIESAVDSLAPVLRREQLVVLESTTYPGTTEELIQPRLEAGGMRAGTDFYLGFAPERIDPGGTTSGDLTFKNVPKLVAGATPLCVERVAALYRAVVDTVVPVTSLKTAEMAKLVENAFRMVNVGFANEVALWCDQLGLDVWEVIDAAATKPFGFMPHYPGPGLGGHCIPVDPYYLVWKLKTLDYPARFIELAGEINRSMPAFVVSKIQAALERHGRPLRGSKVLVLGAAYKRDVADTRESPSLDVLSLLIEHGAGAQFHDPHVSSVSVVLSERALAHSEGSLAATRGPSSSSHKEAVKQMERVDLWPAAAEADCVVVCTDHTAYDWETLASRARLIVDARNALRHVSHPRAEIVKL
ncbi:MAG TPA: nucleotide sugar dehydrogenase [Chloroflexota bacterium]|nr:nucleotide sugar dehydrogenase [Chloroflexota bacterium]